MKKYSMPLTLHCLVPCVASVPGQREVTSLGEHSALLLKHCLELLLLPSTTKPSLGFASCVSAAAATSSHRWPPQLSPLPRGHWACGSLSTFTEHRWCRRQQKPAAHSPVAPKTGEIRTQLL